MIRRDRFQAKPANLLTPIDSRFLFAVEELYGTRYQSGSFSLINVGSGFHCLRSIFFFFHSIGHSSLFERPPDKQADCLFSNKSSTRHSSTIPMHTSHTLS